METLSRCVKGSFFFDAIFLPGGNMPVFDQDYITPHGNDSTNFFSEPGLIQFLRIRPGITVCFRFGIPGKNSFLPAKETILSLFKKIILDTGAGAKTNYGYSRLASCDR